LAGQDRTDKGDQAPRHEVVARGLQVGGIPPFMTNDVVISSDWTDLILVGRRYEEAFVLITPAAMP
jgi:hypothetical protein